MAREKATAFTGATAYDVDVDALTYRRLLKNAAGEAAKLYDQITGENGETDTINHSGPGRGALLGVPAWNQRIGASLTFTSPVAPGSKKGVPGVTWILAQPFHVPDGETAIDVEIVAGGPFEHLGPLARCTTTTGTDVDVKPLVSIGPVSDGELYRARIEGLSRGLYLILVEVDLTVHGYRGESITLESWSGFYDRGRPQRVATRNDSGQNVGVTEPSATQGVAHVDFDSSLFNDDDAFHGYLVSNIHRNLRGLEEFASGWPAGGNADYTHEDQTSGGVADTTNPARSRFSAATRTLYASEPEVDFPLWSEAFGAMRCDGGAVVVPATTPSVGMLEWFAPFPLSATKTMFRQLLLRFPDFSSSSSKLKWAMLFGTDDSAGVIDWTFYISGPGSASQALTALTPFAAGPSGTTNLILVTGSALGFTGDDIALTVLEWEKTTGSFDNANEEIFALGVCLYWEP